MSPRDNQFDDWLDGKLDKAQAERFENDMMNDKYMQERLSTAKYVEFLASNTATQKVPNWDRSVGTGLEERRWWQWQGLPAFSTALSVLALVMVRL